MSEDNNLEIRMEAINALGDLHRRVGAPPEIATALIQALNNNKSDEIKIAILRWFSPIHSKNDIQIILPAIQSLLTHPNIQVRAAVFSFLDANNLAITGQKINKYVSFKWWKEVVKFGKETIPYLILAATDKDSSVREGAIDTLGQVMANLEQNNDSGYEQGFSILINSLNDKEANNRLAACKALGRVKDIRSVEHLASCIKDVEAKVRIAALDALGNIKDNHSLP